MAVLLAALGASLAPGGPDAAGPDAAGPGAPGGAPGAVVFQDRFETDTLGDWSVRDEGLNASRWQVADGQLRQSRFTGNFGSALELGYHRGSYAYPRSPLDLAGYTWSVTATPLAESGEAIGVMFGYHDADNYYRFSTSFADGYSRLEKKLEGRFATLAQNARGYPPGTPLAIVVRRRDGVVQLSVNGHKLFSAHDSDLDGGSLAVYTRDASVFDDMVVTSLDNRPRIALAQPSDYSVQSGASFAVAATVLNGAGAGVEFAVDGDTGACTRAEQARPGWHTGTCTGPGPGVHRLSVRLIDGERVLDEDRHDHVATEGNVYVAIGDSIFWGEGDLYADDGSSRDGWRRSRQGFQASLLDHLNAAAPPANLIYSEAVRGDRMQWLRRDRLSSYLERHADADYAIIGLGTNDAHGSEPLPSGADAPPERAAGTFKGHLEAVVETLNEAGLTPIVVQVPPRFGDDVGTPPFTDPSSHPVNARTISEYNRVIRGEDRLPLSGYIVGPDLLDYFLTGGQNRFHLFHDNLHLNGLAHEVLAAQLRNTLTGTGQLPFVVNDLCIHPAEGDGCATPTPYKQDLLEPGDRPYVDRDHVIVSRPAALSGGRWIRTADADLERDVDDYLSFSLPQPAAVLVGIDDNARVPEWMAGRGFRRTDWLIETSHPAAPRLRVHARTFPAGTVRLGGMAASTTGAGANCVVVVAPGLRLEESG